MSDIVEINEFLPERFWMGEWVMARTLELQKSCTEDDFRTQLKKQLKFEADFNERWEWTHRRLKSE